MCFNCFTRGVKEKKKKKRRYRFCLKHELSGHVASAGPFVAHVCSLSQDFGGHSDELAKKELVTLEVFLCWSRNTPTPHQADWPMVTLLSPKHADNFKPSFTSHIVLNKNEVIKNCY